MTRKTSLSFFFRGIRNVQLYFSIPGSVVYTVVAVPYMTNTELAATQHVPGDSDIRGLVYTRFSAALTEGYI